jgi:hypothetical protein
MGLAARIASGADVPSTSDAPSDPDSATAEEVADDAEGAADEKTGQAAETTASLGAGVRGGASGADRREAPPKTEPPPEEEARSRAFLERMVADASVVVGFERAIGAYAWSSVIEVGTFRSDLSGTMANLGLVNTGTNSPEGALNPFAASRVAADFVVRSFTLGLAFGWAAASGDREDRVGGESRGVEVFPSGSALLFSPRLGYILTIEPRLAFWPRAGATFVSLSDDDGAIEQTVRYFAVTLEPGILFTPIPHVGVWMGPVLDIGIGGGGHYRDASGAQKLSASFSNLGGAVGGIAYW